jgi:hypothetical protein
MQMLKQALNCFEHEYVRLFDASIGLKQGETLSPLLSILLLNDINNCLDFNNLSEVDLNQLSMYMLIFADDIVL